MNQLWNGISHSVFFLKVTLSFTPKIPFRNLYFATPLIQCERVRWGESFSFSEGNKMKWLGLRWNVAFILWLHAKTIVYKMCSHLLHAHNKEWGMRFFLFLSAGNELNYHHHSFHGINHALDPNSRFIAVSFLFCSECVLRWFDGVNWMWRTG